MTCIFQYPVLFIDIHIPVSSIHDVFLLLSGIANFCFQVSSIIYPYTYFNIQYSLLPLIPFKYPVLFILCNFQCAVSYFFIQYFVHFLVIRIINLYTCYNISYLYSQFIYILLLISSILSFKYLVSLSPVHITMFIFQNPVS